MTHTRVVAFLCSMTFTACADDHRIAGRYFGGTDALDVSAPQPGTRVALGETLTVRWLADAPHGIAKVDIRYSPSEPWKQILEESASLGVARWIVAGRISDSAQLRVRLRESEALSAPFAIVEKSSVILTSPRSGDRWVGGKTGIVTWSARGAVGPLKLQLSTDGGLTFRTLAADLEPAAERHVIPSVPSSNSHAVFRLRDRINVSEVDFEITEGLAISSPDLGATLTGGDLTEVRWARGAEGVAVTASYSLDGGASWKDIGTTAEKSLTWLVPSVSNERVYLRVSSAREFDRLGPLAISPQASVTVTAPNGGELLSSDDQVTVRWDSQGLDRVDVLVSTDGGANFDTLEGDVDASNGYVEVSRVAPSSTTVFRVQGRGDSARVFDESDGTIAVLSANAWYVDASAPSPGSGDDWSHAFGSIDDAIAVAMPGDSIHVAAGHYTRRANDGALLAIPDGVALFGGYSPGGLGREPWRTATVLDGEGLAGPVVTARSGVLDGFAITGGNDVEAGGSGAIQVDGDGDFVLRNSHVYANRGGVGGAIAIGAGSGSLRIEQSGFADNRGTDGGALAVLGPAQVTIKNAVFEGNGASHRGGALYGVQGGSVSIISSVFAKNRSPAGGALWLGDVGRETTIERCLFASNEAAEGGAAYLSHGAQEDAGVVVLSSRFEHNSARSGGAMFISGGNESSLHNLAMLWNNAVNDGSAIFLDGASTKVAIRNATVFDNRGSPALEAVSGAFLLRNTIVWGNAAGSVRVDLALDVSERPRYSIVEGGLLDTGYEDGVQILDSDPLFVAGDRGDLRLSETSPAVDAADGAEAPSRDIRGLPRYDALGVENVGTGTPNYADLGAYERR